MSRAWNRQSMAWVTFGVFIAVLAAFWVAAYPEWCHTQQAHAQPCGYWTADYWTDVTGKTLEAFQGEAWQIWGTIVVTSVFFLKGAAESRDSDERVEVILRHVAHKVGLTDEQIEEITQRRLDEAKREHPWWKWAYFAVVVFVLIVGLSAAVKAWP